MIVEICAVERKSSNKDSDSEEKGSEEDKDKFDSKDFDRLFKGIKFESDRLQRTQRPFLRRSTDGSS